MVKSGAVALAIAPMALGYLGVWACPIQDPERPKPPSSPPPWVFMVVWPVLYALMGWAWYLAAASNKGVFGRTSLAISGIQVCLSLWTYVHGCKGRVVESSWILVAACLATLHTIWISAGTGPSVLLLPLAGWLGFATFLNFQMAFVENKLKHQAMIPQPVRA